jgi:phage shock protein PspC (stress-responsive transcriptional regulator)
MECPQCGTENIDTAKFCSKCGRELNGKQSDQAPVAQAPQSQATKTLVRCSDNKELGGVCAGLAKYFDQDVNLVRILTVVSFLITGSVTFWAYIIAWIVLPEEECGKLN